MTTGDADGSGSVSCRETRGLDGPILDKVISDPTAEEGTKGDTETDGKCSGSTSDAGGHHKNATISVLLSETSHVETDSGTVSSDCSSVWVTK